jgi:hypothetical protein
VIRPTSRPGFARAITGAAVIACRAKCEATDRRVSSACTTSGIVDHQVDCRADRATTCDKCLPGDHADQPAVVDDRVETPGRPPARPARSAR